MTAETKENIVLVSTNSGDLEGTLLVADYAEKKTVALIIAGSGPTDRNGNNPVMSNNALKLLAHGLLENNISSFRYDKRGVGKSAQEALNESDLRFETYIDDAIACVEFLKALNTFNEIIIIGHSEGSLIGMVVSQLDSVDKFISLAGSAIPIAELLRQQLKAQPSVAEQAIPILDQLLQGETVDNVPESLQSLFRPSIQPYMISRMNYEPQVELAKLDKPILAVQGTTDIQIRSEDVDFLAKANSRVEVVVLEKMNHVLKTATSDREVNIATYSDPDLPLHAELLPAIFQFLDR